MEITYKGFRSLASKFVPLRTHGFLRSLNRSDLHLTQIRPCDASRRLLAVYGSRHDNALASCMVYTTPQIKHM